MAKLKLKYFWKNMLDDVTRYIERCTQCLERKRPQKRYGELQPIKPTRPFHTIAVDFVGPLQRTQSNNLYIITAICVFSKWAETRAVRNQEAGTVADFLETQIYNRFGAPRYLITDNAKYFASDLLAVHSKNFNVIHRFTSPYHSESAGQIERFNRSIQQVLSNYVPKHDHSKWDTYLSTATFFLNSTISETTKKSPFEIIYGRSPDFPHDFPNNDNCSDWEIQLKSFKEDNDKVKAQIDEAQQKYKSRIDKKRSIREFYLNDIVFLREPLVPRGLSKKLYRPYVKCKVVHKVSPLTYDVQCEKTKRVYRANIKRLKPGFKQTSPDSGYSPSDSSSDEEQRNPIQICQSSSDNDIPTPQQPPPAQASRPQRTRRIPSKYNDFILY